MELITIFLAIAALGHILCGICDCLLTYTPNGRFSAADLADNDKMSALFDGMPLRRPIISTLLGCLALAMCFSGYVFLALDIFVTYDYKSDIYWMCGSVMLISAVIYFFFGTAHHVICGAIEWFYVKLGRTEQARDAIVEFFKKTSLTMILCYLGTAVYCVALFAALLNDVPLWICLINTIPIYLIMSLFKLPGAGNWAGAIMCGALSVLLPLYGVMI